MVSLLTLGGIVIGGAIVGFLIVVVAYRAAYGDSGNDSASRGTERQSKGAKSEDR